MKKVTAFFLVTILSCILLWSRSQTDLIVQGLGSPDEYGNCLVWHTVEQWNGSDWIILLNHTSSSNWTERVHHARPTRFQVKWRLNNTLADSESEAIQYTKILMNISTVWTNEELNNTSSSSDATYYYGIELGNWNQTAKPESGVTYEVATKYEAYY